MFCQWQIRNIKNHINRIWITLEFISFISTRFRVFLMVYLLALEFVKQTKKTQIKKEICHPSSCWFMNCMRLKMSGDPDLVQWLKRASILYNHKESFWFFCFSLPGSCWKIVIFWLYVLWKYLVDAGKSFSCSSICIIITHYNSTTSSPGEKQWLFFGLLVTSF